MEVGLLGEKEPPSQSLLFNITQKGIRHDHSTSYCQASSILNYSYRSKAQSHIPEKNASGPETHS